MTATSKNISDSEIALKDGAANDAYSVIDFSTIASLGAGVLITTKQAYFILPIDAKIVTVHGWCDTETGVSTFDVYDEAGTPATILSAPVSLTTQATQYAGTVASPSTQYSEGHVFSLRATTVASTGALTNLRVSLGIKSCKANVVSA